MKLANVLGRAVLLTSDRTDRGVDVAEASSGAFGPDLPGIYSKWAEFRSWADAYLADHGVAPRTMPEIRFLRSDLHAPSPRPAQILAIGLNYAEHAAESGFDEPDSLPPTFTKFVSALAGPDVEVTLPPNGNVDWEVELVVVIGRTTVGITRERAWDAVAGLTIGQDISERVTQMAGPVPQFSLGKSFPNFAPTGPWLVTPEEFPDRDSLGLGCSVDGEVLQDGRSADLIFSVPALISLLSEVVTLSPGDLIFTGTPAGVGVGRKPPRFLKKGQKLESWIEGIGTMAQTFVSSPAQSDRAQTSTYQGSK